MIGLQATACYSSIAVLFRFGTLPCRAMACSTDTSRRIKGLLDFPSHSNTQFATFYR